MSGFLVLCAALGGCTSTVGGTASPARSEAPTEPPAPSAAQLQSAVVQLADLPPGWTAGTWPEHDGEMMTTFAHCLGAPAAPGDRLREAASPAFTGTLGERVNSSVVSYRTEELAEQAGALFRDARASSCFAQALGDLTGAMDPPGASRGTPEVTVTPGIDGGPGTVVATAASSLAVVTPYGEARTVYMDFVVVRGRSTEAVIALGSVDAPPAPEVRDPVVRAVAQRIAPL
jgi:hypothetical protein